MKFRQVLLAFVLASLVAAVTYAAHTTEFVACTADHFSATLTLGIADSAPASVYKEIGTAFQTAAAEFDFKDFVGYEGFAAFRSLLTDEDWDAIEVTNGPPVSGGACK